MKKLDRIGQEVYIFYEGKILKTMIKEIQINACLNTGDPRYSKILPLKVKYRKSIGKKLEWVEEEKIYFNKQELLEEINNL